MSKKSVLLRFSAKICSDVCPWTLSVCRSSRNHSGQFQREKQCFRHEPLLSTQRKANSNMYIFAVNICDLVTWCEENFITDEVDKLTFQCVFITFIRPRRVHELHRVRDQVGVLSRKKETRQLLLDCYLGGKIWKRSQKQYL